MRFQISSAKISKRIRAEINYHPSDPRTYIHDKHRKLYRFEEKGKMVTKEVNSHCTSLDPRCTRSLYQEMKREALEEARAV